MHEGTKGDNQKPDLFAMPVEVCPAKDEDDEKEKSVAEYSAVTKGVPEEETPYGFIKDVRKK